MQYMQQYPAVDGVWHYAVVLGLPLAAIVVAVSGAAAPVHPVFVLAAGLASSSFWELVWRSQPPVVEVLELRDDGVVLARDPPNVHRVIRVRYSGMLANPLGPRRLAAMFGDEDKNAWGGVVVFLFLEGSKSPVTIAFASSPAATAFGARAAATIGKRGGAPPSR